MAKRLLVRALSFSLAACVPLVVADAIWGTGFESADLPHRLMGLHGLYHVGTVTLSTLGAWLAFRTIGGQGPSIVVAGAFGLLFGLVSIVAAPAALVIADAPGCAFWQFIGGMFAAALVTPRVKPADVA